MRRSAGTLLLAGALLLALISASNALGNDKVPRCLNRRYCAASSSVHQELSSRSGRDGIGPVFDMNQLVLMKLKFKLITDLSTAEM